MKIKIDLSGLDEFTEKADKEINEAMTDIGKEAVAYAKEYGNYQNHTHNLRNAVGMAVVRDGEIKELYIPSGSGHAEAKEKTEALIMQSEKPNDGIILADGMEYASFVESKEFDVLSGAALYAQKQAKAKFKTN